MADCHDFSEFGLVSSFNIDQIIKPMLQYFEPIISYMLKHMKLLLYILAMILLVSCASLDKHRPDFPVKGDARRTTVYAGKTYYVVTTSQLAMVRKKDDLTYVGSTADYHLFKEWLKVLSISDEIYLFALEKHDCVVKTERTPEDEEKVMTHPYKGWRAVDLSNNGCLVRNK